MEDWRSHINLLMKISIQPFKKYILRIHKKDLVTTAITVRTEVLETRVEVS